MADLISMLSAASGAVTAETDPNFKQTVLLLHGDGTNGAQNNTFLDGSTNNFTITRNGNTTQGTFSPFSVGAGQWSNYFDGTGDYLQYTSNNSAFDLSSGSFTVEAWVYQLSAKLVNVISYKEADWRIQINANQSVSYVTPYSERIISSSGAAALNTWNHLAISCDGTTVTLYINGVSAGTSNVLPSSGASTGIYIGRNAATTAWDFNGYISNVRVVKGTNVYPSAFTPPTAPLTAITNTSLLTCQSNRFVDNSTNAFAITRNGDVRVTPFSPFAPTAAYSAGTNGGSGYFDGTGDYLTAPNNAVFDFGSGDFTIEAWVYSTVVSGDQIIYFKRASNINYGPISLIVSAVSGTNRVAFIGSTTGSSWDITFTAGATPIPTNTWAHIAVVRTGTNIYAYVNGVRDATVSGVSGALMTNSDAVSIGAGSTNGQNTFSGLISSFRVVKGTALYTGTTYTVPTAPLTAITNTSLLCNFTNAGIFDNTGKNNLETVGNAQIDTTTKKYGTGSMEFDGTGDWLYIPDSDNWDFGSGNFTIEFWYNADSLAAFHVLVQQAASTTSRWILYWSATNGMVFDVVSGSVIISVSQGATTGWSTGTWYHVALVRNGNNFAIYRNGTSIASATDSDAIPNYAAPLYIGGGPISGDVSLDGFIDDLRITKGVARYTANFTAPTKAFPDQ
jgi:hypothetical protein